MSIIDKLPKAPLTSDTNDTGVNKKDIDHIFNDRSTRPIEDDMTFDESTPAAESLTHNSQNGNIPVELMDTRGFQTSINAATRARNLAAIYTKYAEKNELPPIELLQSDDELAEAIQKTLILRAKDFFDTSRKILQSTLDDGDANDFLESEQVSTIDALYDIHEGHK